MVAILRFDSLRDPANLSVAFFFFFQIPTRYQTYRNSPPHRRGHTDDCTPITSTNDGMAHRTDGTSENASGFENAAAPGPPDAPLTKNDVQAIISQTVPDVVARAVREALETQNQNQASQQTVHQSPDIHQQMSESLGGYFQQTHSQWLKPEPSHAGSHAGSHAWPNPGPATEPWKSAAVSQPEADPRMVKELAAVAANIDRVAALRRRYLELSLQRDSDNPKNSPDWCIHPPPPEPAWVSEPGKAAGSSSNSLNNSMKLNSEAEADDSHNPSQPDQKRRIAKKRNPGESGEDIGEDFDLEDFLPVPGDCDMEFRLDDSGVYQVFVGSDESSQDTPLVHVPTIREFYMDLEEILDVCADGPSKSFAFRRLQYLDGQFNMYTLLNEYHETADSKRVPHRDFYNVRKVDTHVHHSACMNQKHLLRFIKSKMKKCPDEVVIERDDRLLTLAEVFESINLTAYDLSIDTLDMHVSWL